MPSHDIAIAGASRTVVLTDLEPDGASVLVIPHQWAVAQLSTWWTLKRARTFGQARRDAGASRLIEQRLQELSGERRDPNEGYRTSGKDRAKFDASELFGAENWRDWTPNPREATADFLQGIPDLAGSFLRPDTEWGEDYDPIPFVDPDDRTALEAILDDRTYVVRQWPGLAFMYLDPPLKPQVALALPLKAGA